MPTRLGEKSIPRASYTINTVELTCPICSANVLSRSGSMFWMIDEMEIRGSKPAMCENGHAVRMPAKYSTENGV